MKNKILLVSIVLVSLLIVSALALSVMNGVQFGNHLGNLFAPYLLSSLIVVILGPLTKKGLRAVFLEGVATLTMIWCSVVIILSFNGPNSYTVYCYINLIIILMIFLYKKYGKL